MNLHRRPSAEQGRQEVVRPGEENSRVGLDLLRLGAGQHYQARAAAEELVVVLLGGRVDLATAGLRAQASRTDVWSAPATAFYLPAQQEWVLTAQQDAELAICRAPSLRRGQPQHIGPEDTHSQERGRDLFQRRVVDIVADNVDAHHLIVGETFNRQGHWSSYPPHKHDQHCPPAERKLEEVYFYRIRPAQGFAFAGVYTSDGTIDQAFRVLDHDVVLLPRGYHPVAAAPGYELYYLWALAGDERHLSPRTDPDHAWLVDHR